MISETAAIIVLFVGVCAAMVYAYFIKRVLGDFVRTLDGMGACDTESARSLEELGFGKVGTLFIRKSLGKGAVLRRFIAVLAQPEITADDEEEIPDNIPGQKYYIIPEKRDEVLRRYKKDGTSIPALIACIALLLAAALFLTVVYPYFRSALEGMTGSGEDKATVENIVGETPGYELPEGIETKPATESSDAENGEIPEIIIDANKNIVQNRFETAE